MLHLNSNWNVTIRPSVLEIYRLETNDGRFRLFLQTTHTHTQFYGYGILHPDFFL